MLWLDLAEDTNGVVDPEDAKEEVEELDKMEEGWLSQLKFLFAPSFLSIWGEDFFLVLLVEVRFILYEFVSAYLKLHLVSVDCKWYWNVGTV